MKQADIKLLEPYFAFFKEDVDLTLGADGSIIATNGKIDLKIEKYYTKTTAFDEVLAGNVLSYDKQPQGTFKLVITQGDCNKAEDGYWSDNCPLGQAIKRSFPNIEKFKTHEGAISYQNGVKRATIYPVFKESDYKSFYKEFKTTITFL